MSVRFPLFASVSLMTLTIAGVAIAQSGPFDSAPPAGTAPAARPYAPPAQTAPQPAPYTAPAGPYSAPAPAPYQAQPYSAPQAAPGYAPARRPAAPSLSTPVMSAPALSAPYAGTPNYPASPAQPAGTYYPPNAPSPATQFSRGAAFTDPNYRPGSYSDAPSRPPVETLPQYSNAPGPMSGGPMSGGPMSGGPMTNGPYGGPQQPRTAPRKRSFLDKIGLGKLRLKTDGYLRLGDAYVVSEAADGTDNDRNELVVDGMIRSEVSAITQGGIEYGVSLKLRGQRDRLREGFGGLAGDCPPGFGDCAVFTLAGTPRSLKGHTGQLFNFATPETREQKAALEGAHIFIRSAYGDVTLGRDDGSAALFSGSAPSTLPLARASSSRTDYTGLDMTKTRNDASGFSEKITYTSPRLLGDQIGFGVQFGVSYAPDTTVCGVDYCVSSNDLNDPLSPLAPSLEDAIEFGLAIDRTFGSGLSVEGTLNYATASETTGYDVFDTLQSWGTGLNIGYGNFEFGTNYLSSNNGIADDGDYSAFDAGLTWKPAAWGVTLGYGQSKDDLSKTEGRSVVLGGSYDWNKNFTLGTGVQYTEREVPFVNGVLVDSRTEDALALFIEGGFKF